MAYKRTSEVKLVRVKHEVSFYEGARALDLLDSLKHVPAEAKLVDFNEEGLTYTLVFQEEKNDG